MGVTSLCLEYLRPLIEGEAYPPYENGIPKYVKLDLNIIEKLLPNRD